MKVLISVPNLPDFADVGNAIQKAIKTENREIKISTKHIIHESKPDDFKSENFDILIADITEKVPEIENVKEDIKRSENSDCQLILLCQKETSIPKKYKNNSEIILYDRDDYSDSFWKQLNNAVNTACEKISSKKLSKENHNVR